MDAYQLDNDRVRMNNLDENNQLNDPYFIPRLQNLLAELEAANFGSDTKDSSSSDHIINTRLVMNRRPGLLRLKRK